MSLRLLSKIYLGFNGCSTNKKKEKEKTQAATTELFLGRCVWRNFHPTNGSIGTRLRGISVRHDRHGAGVTQVQLRLEVSLGLLFLAGLEVQVPELTQVRWTVLKVVEETHLGAAR